jgi:tetratricopeptide (TPR) repeat protein
MREWLARNEFVPASEADPAIPGWDALPRLAERPPVDEAALEIARRDARTPEELGQLALTEWSAGEREAAWGTSRRALAAYAARGDRIGFSRCLNNQAQFSAMVGELDEACRLSRAALAARADAGDLPGQIATLGWLAQYELDRNRPHAAADAASRGIALAELEPVDPHVLLEAGLTLLAAHGELGDDLEVERTARRLLTLFAGIDAPGLDEVRAYLGHFLDDAQSPSPPQPETNALDEMWAEADRFAVLGEVRKTEEILDRLEREFDLTPVQLGRIEGTRGLALQNGGRSDEAFDAFERAIARMDAAGDQEGAARAEMRVAIIARNDNRFQTSAEILRKALLRPLSPESRHDLQIALANTLQGAYQALEPADPDLLAQARRLLTLVSEETNEVERRGIALVNLGVNQALEDDSDTAVATIQTALKDLRRANSGHVAGAEQLLEQLGGGR